MVRNDRAWRETRGIPGDCDVLDDKIIGLFPYVQYADRRRSMSRRRSEPMRWLYSGNGASIQGVQRRLLLLWLYPSQDDIRMQRHHDRPRPARVGSARTHNVYHQIRKKIMTTETIYTPDELTSGSRYRLGRGRIGAAHRRCADTRQSRCRAGSQHFPLRRNTHSIT